MKAIGPDILASEPEIGWREIAKMRDLLTHRYFGTDRSIVAQVVNDELGALRDAVSRLKQNLADSERP